MTLKINSLDVLDLLLTFTCDVQYVDNLTHYSYICVLTEMYMKMAEILDIVKYLCFYHTDYDGVHTPYCIIYHVPLF
jgi:hypothetical protein